MFWVARLHENKWKYSGWKSWKHKEFSNSEISNDTNVNIPNLLGDIQNDEKTSYSKVVQKGTMNKKVNYEVNFKFYRMKQNCGQSITTFSNDRRFNGENPKLWIFFDHGYKFSILANENARQTKNCIYHSRGPFSMSMSFEDGNSNSSKNIHTLRFYS